MKNLDSTYSGKYRAIRNGLIGSGTQFLMIASAIITTPYITRIFSAEQMGVFAVSYSICAFLTIVASFGVEQFGPRLIATSENRENRSRNFYSLWVIQTVASITIFCIYEIILLQIHPENLSTYMLQGGLILSVIFDLSWLFMGVENMRKAVSRNIISKIIIIIAIFVFIKHPSQLNTYIILNIVGIVVGNLSAVFSINKYVTFTRAGIMDSAKYFKPTFKMMLSSVGGGTIYPLQNIIVYMSQYGSAGAGVMDQSTKILNMFYSMAMMGIKSVTPRLSHHAINAKNGWISSKYIIAATAITTIVCSIVTVTMTTVSKDFTSFFYGPQFSQVAGLLAAASWCLFPRVFTLIINNMHLIPSSLDNVLTFSTYIRVLITIVCSLIFLKIFGLKGIFYAVVIAELSSVFITLLKLRNFHFMRIFLLSTVSWVAISLASIALLRIITIASYGSPVRDFLVKSIVSTSIVLVLSLVYAIFIRQFRFLKD
ncbi:oligosaccharide flippase family protein [Candidatus Saccharibacteria bacterium]|nr:MAG: oligosaccharide flippase family protein [Candidatus Saccharibacteria bacterium]